MHFRLNIYINAIFRREIVDVSKPPLSIFLIGVAIENPLQAKNRNPKQEAVLSCPADGLIVDPRRSFAPGCASFEEGYIINIPEKIKFTK